jgi:hypothetical protein
MSVTLNVGQRVDLTFTFNGTVDETTVRVTNSNAGCVGVPNQPVPTGVANQWKVVGVVGGAPGFSLVALEATGANGAANPARITDSITVQTPPPPPLTATGGTVTESAPY